MTRAGATGARRRAKAPAFTGYDYLDFGCSKGANIDFTGTILPGARGLGIDIDPAKIAAANAAGHDALVYDILALPEEKIVDFVTMAHFLEHLFTIEDARKMIAKAISVARHCVVIRQPWFDSDGDLLRHGLKFYWSHWRGHRNKMTSLDFHSILSAELARGRIAGFGIHGRGPVGSSDHTTLLPLDAPMDQHHYDEALHGPKPKVDLPFQAFKEIIVRIDIAPSGTTDRLMAGIGRAVPLVVDGGTAPSGEVPRDGAAA